MKSGNVFLVRRKVFVPPPFAVSQRDPSAKYRQLRLLTRSPFAHLLFALTHLTSARTTDTRCAMNCLARPPSPGRIKYQITKKERNHNKAVIASFLKSGNVLLVRRKVFVPPPSVTVRALTFCAHSSHFGTHNGYPLCYEMPRSSSLAREDKMSNHKKRTQPQQSCGCAFFEIRQRVILPGAMCQVLSPRTSLTEM